ncbi:MAG: rhomboid family intramembrane serine protease [Muribaculaceae bacterium]|nr:rhomboid family intramembrane serine protease [Muribaculaceae bacterium]MDE6164840.1 rhomboid family intramembrane serine protease [Muribaculaceae bacterium]
MYRNSIFSNLPPVTKNLLIINAIVWLATWVLGRKIGLDISDIGGLHYFSSPLFNPAQLLTYMFIHASFMHLFMNMFALFMFGALLERTLGSARFLFYYISCGIGAALIQEGVYAVMIGNAESHLTPQMIDEVMKNGAGIIAQGMNYIEPALGHFNILLNNATVGASGAIYGILLAFGMLWPDMPLYIMFIPVPVKAKWMVAGYAGIELLLGLQNSVGDNVAHFAHLGGMLIGLVMILYWKRSGLFHRRW